MRPYATADDLAGTSSPGQVAWLSPDQLETIGDDADRLLMRASEVIAEHVTTGYWLNSDGDPGDAHVRVALADATCAQVEQWLEVGEENDIAGYSRATAMSVGISVSSLPAVLAPRARRILRQTGLMRAVSW